MDPVTVTVTDGDQFPITVDITNSPGADVSVAVTSPVETPIDVTVTETSPTVVDVAVTENAVGPVTVDVTDSTPGEVTVNVTEIVPAPIVVNVEAHDGGPKGDPGPLPPTYAADQAAQDSAISDNAAALAAIGLEYNSGTRAISVTGSSGSAATLPLASSAAPSFAGLITGSQIDDLEDVRTRMTTAESDIGAVETDVAAIQAANYSRFVAVSGYRMYDDTRGPGSFTITAPTTIRGVSLSGADALGMSITTVTGLGGYVSVRPYNSTDYSFSVVNNDANGGLANGAVVVEIDSSRRFTAAHNTNNFRAIYDVWGIFWY